MIDYQEIKSMMHDYGISDYEMAYRLHVRPDQLKKRLYIAGLFGQMDEPAAAIESILKTRLESFYQRKYER